MRCCRVQVGALICTLATSTRPESTACLLFEPRLVSVAVQVLKSVNGDIKSAASDVKKGVDQVGGWCCCCCLPVLAALLLRTSPQLPRALLDYKCSRNEPFLDPCCQLM